MHTAHCERETPTIAARKESEGQADSVTVRTSQPSWRFVAIAASGVGVVSFLTSELLRYLLVPDIGRVRERLIAEFLTALILSAFTAKLIQITRERHRLMIARMQVVAEMNHHIRNALSPISLSLDATENKQLKDMVADAVERIDWALREVLPREMPLVAEQRRKLGYFQRSI